MKLGLYLRNMGPQSTRAVIAEAEQRERLDQIAHQLERLGQFNHSGPPANNRA